MADRGIIILYARRKYAILGAMKKRLEAGDNVSCAITDCFAIAQMLSRNSGVPLINVDEGEMPQELQMEVKED